MTIHHFFFTTLLILMSACLSSLSVEAQSLSGTYTGSYENNAIKLILQANGQELGGTLSDGTSTFDIIAYAEGNYWVGTATDKSSSGQAVIAAELKGNDLEIALTSDGVNSITFHLERASSSTQAMQPPKTSITTPTPSTTSSKGSVEPPLVGTWIKSVSNSSGYGGNMAYFQTDVMFRINADGSFEYGATRSVGGGGDWSYDGSQWSAPEATGFLRSNGKNIYMLQANGQAIAPNQQDMGTYYIDNNMMSTTGKNGIKEYWKRQ